MMTTITSSQGGSTVNEPTRSTVSKTNMDYDSFLRLFMAQMKNQDPTEPNDPTETLSQLASFSNVEQSIKLNEKLDALLSASNATLASALVGRNISNLDATVSGIAVEVTVGASGPSVTLADGRVLSLADGYKVGNS